LSKNNGGRIDCMNVKSPIVVLALFFLFSCNNKKNSAFYDSSDIEQDLVVDSNSCLDLDQLIKDSNIISVPFIERNGVKYVKVSVNGLDLEMIFDTGCSSTLISVAEANYLYQKGYLTEDDYLGKSQAQVADGSIVEDMVFNLKEVIIDNKIHCSDVTATVSANTNVPLLLGNEVLDRVASYTMDNRHQIINFKLR